MSAARGLGTKSICCSCVLAFASPSLAQVTPLPGTSQPNPVKPTLDIGLDVAGGYTDNLFATRNDEADDYFVLISPSSRLTIVDGPNRLVLRAEGEIGKHEQYESEDYEDWLLGADARYRISDNVTLLAGGELQWEHENRASPDAENGLRPTEYRRLYAFAGTIARLGQFTLRPAVQLSEYDFDDVGASSGIINNDDRDRSQMEAGARIAYALSDRSELFVQGTWDRREYDRVPDDFGYSRDSRGGSVGAGVRRTFSPQLNAEVSAGYLAQDYSDARLKDVSGFDVGALVNWQSSRGLAATFRLDRAVEETTLPGASSYVVTAGSLALTATPHPRIQTGLTVAASKYDYRGDPRSEFVTSGNLWGRYWLNSHIYAGANYELSRRTSNAAGLDYDENRLLFRLGANLEPHYNKIVSSIAFSEVSPAGFYAGLFGSHGLLGAGLNGPRGQGSNTADFGDFGLAGGAMAGYGTVVGSVYLGAELEASAGGPDWLHVADRIFSMEKKDSFGLNVRAGWVTLSNDLIFGRAGISRAAIAIQYDHAGNYSDEKRRLTGLSFGLGSEATVGSRGFVRTEFVATSYPDVDVSTGEDKFDNFSPSDTQFRVGAGLRFGGRSSQPSKEAQTTRFNGPYVGLEVGLGGLVSANRGVRSGGTEVDIQRAGSGPVAGVFAGWGTLLHRFYVGGEAEADISGVDWNIERDPNGRIYSAQLQSSLGVSARAGWLISNSALLYGRIGVAWSRFRIPYATSGDSVLSKRTRSGLRLGGGMEIGLSARTRFRLDYSMTEYGGYGVEYGESNSDHFKHRGSLARAGIALAL